MSGIKSSESLTLVNKKLPFVKLGSSLQSAIDPDVMTFQTNIRLNGGSISTSSLLAVNTFVLSLKAQNLWTRILDMGVFAGDGLKSALTKLKYDSASTPFMNGVNLVEADYVERGVTGGVKGNGTTKYIDTRYTGSGGYVYNDAHIAAYVRGVESLSGSRVIVGRETPGVFSYLGVVNAGAWEAGVVLGTSAPGNYVPQTQTTKLQGFLAVSAFQGISQQYYTQGVKLGTAVNTASSTLAANFFLLADNDGVSPASLFSTRYLQFHSLGKGLSDTDMIALNIAVQTLQTALSRAT